MRHSVAKWILAKRSEEQNDTKKHTHTTWHTCAGDNSTLHTKIQNTHSIGAHVQRSILLRQKDEMNFGRYCSVILKWKRGDDVPCFAN